MKEHELIIVDIEEHNIFKDEEVCFIARYEYCDKADTYSEDEELITRNDKAFKGAYYEKMKAVNRPVKKG